MIKSKKVLMTLEIPEQILAKLASECTITLPRTGYPMPRSELLELISGHDALFCTSSDKIDKELLDIAGDKLKVVCTMSAGFNHIDVEEAKARKISLGHTPDVLTDSVAEINLALILSCLRGIKKAENSVTTGVWEQNLFAGLGESLVGKTIGFLGLGRIGLETAKRLLPFKIGNIYYCNRSESSLAVEVAAIKVSLDDLANYSDIVIVCASLNESTKHIINKQFLNNMKQSAFLINTSRGGLVDQDALIEALETGRIRGAGLDVMTPEPLPSNSPLISCPNIVLFPHIGSATTQTRENMAWLTVENILASLKKEKLPAPIL